MEKVMNRVFLLCVLFISGCNSIPESLRVAEDSQLVAFVDVRAQPQGFEGMQARWGGLIAKVEVRSEQTMIEVVNLELKSSTRPRVTDSTAGRFRVFVKGLLDPVIYKEGRSITALGTIGEVQKGNIGEQEYTYPVLNAHQLHLWKDIQEVRINTLHTPYWYYPSYWHYYPTRRVYLHTPPKVTKSTKN
jgi:outer membrane lipoprotein